MGVASGPSEMTLTTSLCQAPGIATQGIPFLAFSCPGLFLGRSETPFLTNLPVKLIGAVAARRKGAVSGPPYVWQGVLGSLCRTGFRNVKADLHCVAALRT